MTTPQQRAVYPDGWNGTTYWNGQPAVCRRVRVVVGPAPLSTWWCAGLVGTERVAVEVRYAGQTFYLDDTGGTGWSKVTTGLGSPWTSHRSLPVSRVVGEIGEVTP